MNWVKIYNLLLPLINVNGEESYFSGVRFINIVREFDASHPDYKQYIENRNSEGLSTSRKDYFYDILKSYDDTMRYKILNRILDLIEQHKPEVSTIRGLMQGQDTLSAVNIGEIHWNAERLNTLIKDIDANISEGNYNRAVSLAYTALEGFYRTFLKQRLPESSSTEIIAMSKEIKTYLRSNIPSFPDEAINLINHISHTVDRTRNGFSESHFGEEADRWLAVYIRDITNANIRLLLHFISQ